ncbi:MAG TPA: triose-phosphate isomerase [Oxalicibacterium sp.]|jgi:triosephosphate isomerase|nr:triose-phosphate isomerase [Oxalicibacterium sp.]
MRRKLIAGNWKMNGSIAANAALLTQIQSGFEGAECDVAVCVPFPYLAQCQSLISGSALCLGAQDVSIYECGAYTGDVCAAMLLEFGCHFVIVGHSERRAYFGESDQLVARKTAVAVEKGLVPIVCVGETREQHEAGLTAKVVLSQLDAVLSTLPADDLEKIVIAYEPVWAIGTGLTATPEMAQEVHAILRARLGQSSAAAAEQVKILYGGSMKPDNAAALLAMPDIDGGLIGGASLKAQDFLAIVHAARAANEMNYES